MNIFIGKLNYSSDTNSLLELFEQFGEVESAKIIVNPETGHSKGYAFVEMPNEEEGQAAIAALDQSEFDGNVITVKKALPR